MSVLLYGATGYTGRLIASRARDVGATVILAGRDAGKVRAVAEPLGFEFRAAPLDDAPAMDALLKGVSVVLHAAGPFSATHAPMTAACFRNRCHYADITGEIAVFEALARRDADARAAGVTLLPGVGFDVVPSDCLAAHVTRRVPNPTHLVLALAALGGVSRGTARTSVEGLGRGTPVRRGGKITRLPRALWRQFDFGTGPKACLTIGWGDVSTAWHSTGVADIEVYFRASRLIRSMTTLGALAGGLLRHRAVQRFLNARIDAWPEGPNEEQRARSQSRILAIASNAAGVSASSRLETPDSYAFTAHTALDAALRLANGEARPGFFTPSKLFGPDYVLGFDGVKRTDLT